MATMGFLSATASLLSLLALPTLSAGSESAAPAPPPLSFSIRQGELGNHFYRSGSVAAHVVTRSGTRPRLVVAFPASNGGAGVWFEDVEPAVEMRVEGELSKVTREDGMAGVRATVEVDAPSLRVRRVILGSIRVLRDMHGNAPPARVRHRVNCGSAVIYGSEPLDERLRYELGVEPLSGTTSAVDDDGTLTLRAPDGALRFRVTALSSARPLTPIPIDELLVDDADADPQMLRALAFLSYEEKLLAGSWRFLTYFGRDTLLSIRLLMGSVRPELVEVALGSVLDRLGPAGEVAHEEDVGEFAALRRLRSPQLGGDPLDPLFDYKMIDDDFLLAPVAAAYLLDTADGRARAPAFLERRTPGEISYAQALRRNLELVRVRARPYSERPGIETLIHLRDGEQVGEWRDSEEGLGGGRIPFNVNASLVPAALRAAARLYESDALRDAGAGADARRLAGAWASARAHFEVELDPTEASRRVTAYAREVGVDAGPAVAALGSNPVRFPAVALLADGRPVDVMHLDDGFVLLFGDPPADELERIAQRLVRPFPAGLRTGVGLVVANPALSASPQRRALFTRDHYHGTVIWSWQQALVAAGLRRQLARDDLPEATRRTLASAEREVWRVIDATAEHRTAELWSWSWDADAMRYAMVPFGQDEHHRTEANAVQLWSTVYLAVRAP